MSIYIQYAVSILSISFIGGVCAYLSARESKKEKTIVTCNTKSECPELEEYREIPS